MFKNGLSYHSQMLLQTFLWRSWDRTSPIWFCQVFLEFIHLYRFNMYLGLHMKDFMFICIEVRFHIYKISSSSTLTKLSSLLSFRPFALRSQGGPSCLPGFSGPSGFHTHSSFTPNSFKWMRNTLSKSWDCRWQPLWRFDTRAWQSSGSPIHLLQSVGGMSTCTGFKFEHRCSQTPMFLWV